MFANIPVLEDEKCQKYGDHFVDDKMICSGFFEVKFLPPKTHLPLHQIVHKMGNQSIIYQVHKRGYLRVTLGVVEIKIHDLGEIPKFLFWPSHF